MSGASSGEGSAADIARILGIPSQACERILQEEEASQADAQEALRRILRHKAYQTGAIRSPAAFFRGVLRRVRDDRETAERRPPPSPPPAKQNAQPASPLGRAYLRAFHLLASGQGRAAAATALQQDFPDAPADLLDQALSWAADLRSLDRSHQA